MKRSQDLQLQAGCALAALLSSVLVYNNMGVVDDHAIQRLAQFCSLAKQLVVAQGAPQQEDGGEDLPEFLWVLRDFSLQMVGPTGEPLRLLTSESWFEPLGALEQDH